jgi:hypothetical protein
MQNNVSPSSKNTCNDERVKKLITTRIQAGSTYLEEKRSVIFRDGLFGFWCDHVLSFSLNAGPVPEFEIQQSPDAIVVIDMTGLVLVEQPLDRRAIEEFSIQTARF